MKKYLVIVTLLMTWKASASVECELDVYHPGQTPSIARYPIQLTQSKDGSQDATFEAEEGRYQVRIGISTNTSPYYVNMTLWDKQTKADAEMVGSFNGYGSTSVHLSSREDLFKDPTAMASVQCEIK